MRRAAQVGIAAAGAGACVAAYQYRPRDLSEVEFYDRWGGSVPRPSWWERPFFALAEAFVIGVTGHVSDLYMRLFQRTSFLNPEDLHKFVLNKDNVRGGRPLVTVMNHHSCLDEPLIMGRITPSSLLLPPGISSMRYGVCTREICFGTSATSAFFGMGRAWPVLRGGTAEQWGLAQMQARLNAGHWVHIFPEARTWQEGGTPLRDSQGRWCTASGRCSAPFSGVGPFKWGVGRLVANSAVVPIVVPVFHQGMAPVLPQTSTNDVISFVPVSGSDITIAAGDPVECSDLIAAYHRAAADRAAARHARRIVTSSVAPPPLPMAGHRQAMTRAAQEFGYVPAAFAGVPIPPGVADKPSFARSVAANEAGRAARALAARAFVGALEASQSSRRAGSTDASASSLSHLGSDSDVAAFAEAAVLAGVSDTDLLQQSCPTEARGVEGPAAWSDWDGAMWIPTRAVRGSARPGAPTYLIPSFVEEPLRVRPPDHLWLTADEALEEHRIRLALYAAITDRIEQATRDTEARVLAWRKEHGLGHKDADRR